MPTDSEYARNGASFDLVVFDLDGTILRRDLGISERTIGSVRRLRERGMRLVVATGRHFDSAREHAERLGFEGDDPIVCYGGSMVRRMNGETLMHRTVPEEVSVEVVEWAADRGLHARVFLDGRIVTSPETSAVLEHMRRRDEPNVSVVDSLADFLRKTGEEPTKLVIVDDPETVEDWLGKARRTFSGRLFVTRSLSHYVEIGNAEGTKSRGLGFLCGMWRIDPSRVIAFGDADNDVDMLRFVGHGVAVGGMTAEVREAADVVVPPVDEDGVPRYVEKLLEGK